MHQKSNLFASFTITSLSLSPLQYTVHHVIALQQPILTLYHSSQHVVPDWSRPATTT